MTEQVDAAFVAAVGAMAEDGAAPASLGRHLTAQRAVDLFEAQVTSRHLDLAARWLRLQGKGFYTIGSSGHEGNAAVAAALRPTDPALLHYRSGAFYVARAQQVPGTDAVRDVLLGLVAAADDPIAGGRHKVFGSHELAVVPQTSTIASHLPRALGMAFSIDRATKLGVPGAWPADAVVVAASATPRSTTRRRPARSTPRCTCRAGAPGAAAAGVRGQRARDQRADAGGLGRAGLRPAARPAVLRGRRLRPGRLRRGGRPSGRRGCAPGAGPRSCTCARCG